MNPKINTAQLRALRNGIKDINGMMRCDTCTGQALVRRGFAVVAQDPDEPRHCYQITHRGRQRALKAADTLCSKDGPCGKANTDPSLMQDLPDLKQFAAAIRGCLACNGTEEVCRVCGEASNACDCDDEQELGPCPECSGGNP